MNRYFNGLAVVALFFTQIGWAGNRAAPPCLDTKGRVLPIDNDQVIDWKNSTPNQFKGRAHVSGPVVLVYPDKNDHSHFLIQIGKDENDTLEVIYNINFGELPALTDGDQVEACGDYITSNAPYQRYPASPAGAIIHWIHRAPNPKKHPHGFLTINDHVYGQLLDSEFFE